MNVLGVKIAGHDPGAALITDSRVVAIAEERLNRIKHSPQMFPHLSIAYCLEACAIRPEDVDLVAVDCTTIIGSGPRVDSPEAFMRETRGIFKNARVVRVNHHDAHAATAFFCSPFDDAAILVYDGAGDMLTTNLGAKGSESETLYRGTGNTIVQITKTLHVKSERRFPYTVGIGKLYSILSTDYLSLGFNNEGKMMGLAAYGDDRILKEFPYERWVREHNGAFVCNGQIRFDKRTGAVLASQRNLAHLARTIYWGSRMRARRTIDSFRRRMVAVIGKGIVVDPKIFEPIELPRAARNPKQDSLPDEYYSSIAYAAQKIFERFAIEIGTKLRIVTNAENLCVAGGCALNIDANRNFLTEVGFKNIFVQPASSDSGIPLGCALWGYHAILKQPRRWIMKSASLGRPYEMREIEEAVRARASEIEWVKSANIATDAAALIANGKIIGWFQGGGEYGPRALGNRSILCDARDPRMKDILNKRVKHREVWRPFATSILAESLEEWFDIKPSATTAFMLLAAPVRNAKRSLVPSIVHIDGTCRMQTLTEDDNGIYYRLVKAFAAQTGVPLVLNTSFNLGGEPIVETPADALDTFLRTDMDHLVLGDVIVTKRSTSAQKGGV